MASGLYRLQANISRKIIPCIKHSSSSLHHTNPQCRTVMSIAFNTGFADDSLPVPKDVKKTTDFLTLKEKEKGDWRNLSLEEKQALYRMSFSQPLCEVIDQPADEWKLILAGAFTAMGLMTLGMYVWMSRNECAEIFSGPISFQNELKEEDKVLFHTESVALDSRS